MENTKEIKMASKKILKKKLEIEHCLHQYTTDYAKETRPVKFVLFDLISTKNKHYKNKIMEITVAFQNYMRIKTRNCLYEDTGFCELYTTMELVSFAEIQA